MNIFVVHRNPVTAAQMLCDKHVNKMVTESAQMLSTAHRMLDGYASQYLSANNRRLTTWKLDDDREDVLYKSTHPAHKCNLWIRATTENYCWMWQHFKALSDEYTFRYGRQHAAFYDNDRGERLRELPKKLKNGNLTEFVLGMNSYPECHVPGDPIQSYRNFYIKDKQAFAKWERGRNAPDWWRTV